MEVFWPLLLFVMFMVGTPGPANMIVMTGGAQIGVLRCLPFIGGVICGKLALNIAVGLGLGIILQEHVWLQTGLKFVCAAYMIWLAVQAWTPAPGGGTGSAFTFPKGLLVHPLNPKAWVMVLLAWTDFAPALGSLGTQLLVIAGTFAAVQLVFHTAWCGAGQVVGHAFENALLVNRVLVVLTVAVVIAVLVF
jgi:threonine/homoserine/homoserine lactone efflux protein